MAKKQVLVGQVFQTVGATNGRSWRVRETVTLYGIPHARVVSTEDEGDAKTLSCLVLTDSNYYRMIGSPSAGSVAA
ncbi:hypothetical protein [Azospirillum isscasi]|uniref:Uncharacterized protein n=1 Tax=Azospirillum isscasi TaxID=3053926 RepID=A0ABU0WPB2_9PROT|nr:hypothetical protein [Azospirillum isscasi]MDQ2106060.1 hypothetical protein [Azospirillum isscasi]